MTDLFIQERKYLHNVSPKTLEWYKYAFKAFEGAMDSKAAIIERIKKLSVSNSAVSINTYLRCINAYYMWLHKEHGKELVRIPKLKEEQKILTTLSADMVRSLVHYKPQTANERRIHTLVCLLLDTGLRIEEALTLPSQAVDFDNLVLKVKGKGSKHRLIPFSQELRKVLWRYQRDNDKPLVFSTRNGTPLTARNALRDFKRLGKKLGITGVRFSPHTLRHSFAVGYLRNGGNLEFLRRILGHSSLATTQKYLKSLGVEDLQAVHSSRSILAQVGR